MEKELHISYQEFTSWEELPKQDQDLVEKAYQICKIAYAPYSKFKVGACVLLTNGEVVLGNNQENVAFPSGMCAERVALFSAGANFPDSKIKVLVVVSQGDFLPPSEMLSPCGGCRQVMMECETRQNQAYRVVLVSKNKRTLIFNTVYDLLPFAFKR
jgi:cytidine deaminase